MKEFVYRYLYNGLVCAMALAFFINLIIESVGRLSMIQGLLFIIEKPQAFFYNCLIILVSLSVAMLFRHRIFLYVLISSFWLTLGITNGVVLSFRMTPFTVSDLALLENGLSILPNYMSKFEIFLLIIGIIGLIGLYVVTFIFAPKFKKRISYKTNLAFIIIITLALFGLTNVGINNRWLSTYFSNLGYAYKDYGVPYCFINTWLNRGISIPANYSEKMVLDIFKDGIPMGNKEANASIPVIMTAGERMEKQPNIIYVQLESLIDPMLIKGLEFSRDPLPNFHRLQKENSTGFLLVPSVGAGTANTEFEVLTGMRVMSFGPGEYPYKTVIKQRTCESINYILKDLGYSSHAIHNHRGAFYGRNQVFSNLGFDTFTSVEYMNNIELTPRNWAKDHVLIDEIMAALESTKGPDFVFTISVQGHGEYPKNKKIPDEELDVKITGGVEDEEELNALEYYVQQIYEMDQFIGDLQRRVDELEEDTLVVYYGDHIPVLNLTEDDMENHSIYETQYVMVGNFDFVKIDEDITSYQLSSQVLERLGVQRGILNWYHQTRRNYGNYLDQLEIIQYDMLYGENYIYGGANPFYATDLKMGVRDIRVNKIFRFGENTYLVGKNFTPYSKIAIKGDFVDTIFIRPDLLKIPEVVKSQDLGDFSISQVGKYNTVLSTLEDVE